MNTAMKEFSFILISVGILEKNCTMDAVYQHFFWNTLNWYNDECAK